MKRLFSLTAGGLAAALALASCGTVLKNPLQPSLVFNLENAYGVAQAAALTYSKWPRCSATVTVVCSRASVVVQLGEADKKARIALAALEAFVRNPSNYPGLSYAGLLAAAQSAVAALQQIESTNGLS